MCATTTNIHPRLEPAPSFFVYIFPLSRTRCSWWDALCCSPSNRRRRDGRKGWRGLRLSEKLSRAGDAPPRARAFHSQLPMGVTSSSLARLHALFLLLTMLTKFPPSSLSLTEITWIERKKAKHRKSYAQNFTLQNYLLSGCGSRTCWFYHALI